ncbi:MAG: DegV family protein [Anaerolineae bacterium]|nr:DegV family protein [Anaerolineae bacterium]
MSHSRKIKFVTDSTSDIPQELVEKWGITVIPVFVNIGDHSYADDGVDLRREEYYKELPSLVPLPTTAAPSPGLAKQYIEKAYEGADHLVIVTLASKLSATYDAIRLGASELPPENVTLIDSGSVTLALGYQVLCAAEVAAETGDLEQVLETIHRVRRHSKLIALIDTLEYLRRSGRVNFAAAGLGALLQVKPIITVNDGEVETLSRVRTAKRARQELVELLQEYAPVDRLALLHTNNLEGVTWMKEQLADLLPEEVLTVNVAPTIGTHIGPNCLGFVAVGKSWRS